MDKCVIVLDGDLPVGLIANTAAVLAMSIGRHKPELVGSDVRDGDGVAHAGITTITLPVLRGASDALRGIRERAAALSEEGLLVIDVTDAAQQTKTYDDYRRRLESTPGSGLRFLGLCLYGPSALVKSLTGSLPLFR